VGVPSLTAETPFSEFELIVDALLGTGLNDEVRDPAREMIGRMNASGLPILALDVPSGLDADRGRVLGDAVRAQLTMTFIGRKKGLFTGAARDYCGEVVYADLALPDSLFQRVKPEASLSDQAFLHRLERRRRGAHKGDFGHVLVIGGDLGMAGAARMAAEAAGRVGAGLVSVGTRAAHATLLSATRPELMVHGVESPAALAPLLARATVIAIGPGLGQDDWGSALFAKILECQKPLVVDADALNLLAEEMVRREHWILTPHPGEAGRLLGCSSAEIEADRFSAAGSLHASFGGVVVLKGAGTLVADGENPIEVCARGNPGMASGGMGDILTGVIAGLVAQGFGLGEAARLGVCLHGAAGDAAAKEGERGMLAMDLMPYLRKLANP
jgi:NAD(P)H-hydrate epimerase